MIRESHNAVITRNETWAGAAMTEPYEVGWASELIIFIRALSTPGGPDTAVARVQISADGMHWAEEGTQFPMPSRLDEVTFGKIREFGNWIRIATDIPVGSELKVLVTLSLKA